MVSIQAVEETGNQRECKDGPRMCPQGRRRAGTAPRGRSAPQGKTSSCGSVSGRLSLVLCTHVFEREIMWLLSLFHLDPLV